MSTHTCAKYSVVLSLFFGVLNAHAQATKPCIELKNEAQMEQTYTDAQGKQATRLVAPGKVVPGNEVIYTLIAKNVCDKPAGNVVINNPVPEHMSYVMSSATGSGTDITYSLDGKSFTKLEALSVKNTDGSTRAPRADEIKNIRWTYSTPINAGQSGSVRFRATLN